MKKPYLLLILTLLTVFFVEAKSSKGKQPLTNPDLKGYTLTIDLQSIGRPHDTVIFKKTYLVYYIPVKFSNNTNSPLNYITMTCSWDELFHLNNKHFKILIRPCESNYPYTEILLPHKTSTFYLPIIRERKSIGTETLKIGMNLFIDNAQNRNLFPLPVDKMDNVIWSNEIKIP